MPMAKFTRIPVVSVLWIIPVDHFPSQPLFLYFAETCNYSREPISMKDGKGGRRGSGDEWAPLPGLGAWHLVEAQPGARRKEMETGKWCHWTLCFWEGGTFVRGPWPRWGWGWGRSINNVYFGLLASRRDSYSNLLRVSKILIFLPSRSVPSAEPSDTPWTLPLCLPIYICTPQALLPPSLWLPHPPSAQWILPRREIQQWRGFNLKTWLLFPWYTPSFIIFIIFYFFSRSSSFRQLLLLFNLRSHPLFHLLPFVLFTLFFCFFISASSSSLLFSFFLLLSPPLLLFFASIQWKT